MRGTTIRLDDAIDSLVNNLEGVVSRMTGYEDEALSITGCLGMAKGLRQLVMNDRQSVIRVKERLVSRKHITVDRRLSPTSAATTT